MNPYTHENKLLLNLLNNGINIEHLIHTFKICEERWDFNLNTRLIGRKIKYILIAEAPPWSPPGHEINYFYNNFAGSWCTRIYHTFFPKQKVPIFRMDALDKLAEKNFLFIDSLPFALNYSGKRNTKAYKELIRTCKDWWINKIKSIKFDENLKIAFAFKVNGRLIVDVLNGRLSLTNRTIDINVNLIATDKSNYTSSDKLRNIYNLLT